MWVFCTAVTTGFTAGTHCKFIHIAFSKQDSALLLQKFPYGSIIHGFITLQNFRAAVCFQSACADICLECHGHTLNWSECLPTRNFFIHFLCSIQCSFCSYTGISIQFLILLPDSIQILLCQFYTGTFFGSQSLLYTFNFAE